MKLYATITSERASKGQGGNNHLRLSLKVGSAKDSRDIANLTLVALKNGGYELFYWNKDTDSDAKCLQTGEIKSKGKQQKGEEDTHSDYIHYKQF